MSNGKIMTKNIIIPVSEDMHYKLKAIAAYESRTLAGQMRAVFRDVIEQFEREHGPIVVPED